VESAVVDFLAERLEGNEVGLVASFEIVVSEELFVVEISVLGLDGV